MPLTIIEHSIAHHLISRLRDRNTTADQFRTYSRRMTRIVLTEATRDLALRGIEVETPLEKTGAHVLDVEVVAVPVLRAGLVMLDPLIEILPDASVGYIGMERDENTAQPHSYYCKLPPVEGRQVMVLDPMLATGGSAKAAIELIRGEGAQSITMVCIVAAPEGVEVLERAFPDIRIYAAVLDRELDGKYRIRPGLGDFGDRLFGT